MDMELGPGEDSHGCAVASQGILYLLLSLEGEVCGNAAVMGSGLEPVRPGKSPQRISALLSPRDGS